MDLDSKQQTFIARQWNRLLRSGFRLLYNDLAWTYDVVSWFVSLGQWRNWQLAGLQYLNGRDVLELAHGPGHMLLELESRGFRVVGLDLSPAMGHMASKRLHAARSSVLILRGQAQQLAFQSASFDNVLATFPTEFIVDPATIAQTFRVLRPGGCLVIVVEAQLTGGGPLRVFLEWLYTITGQRQVAHERDQGDQMWFEAWQSFVAAGFDVHLERTILKRSIVTTAIAQKPDLSGVEVDKTTS